MDKKEGGGRGRSGPQNFINDAIDAVDTSHAWLLIDRGHYGSGHHQTRFGGCANVHPCLVIRVFGREERSRHFVVF